MKHIFWKVNSIVFFIACLSYGQVIETRANFNVTGPDILLADLVTNPAELPTAWKTRSIGTAPEPGASITYALRTLAANLEQYKDMSAVWLKGPLNVTVLRDGTVAPPTAFTDAIETYVREHAPWAGKEIGVYCEPIKTPFSIPTGAVVKVLSCDLVRGNDGYRFEVVADTPERRLVQASVVARIALLNKIWVIKHDMTRGEVLKADDLELALPPQGRTGRYLDATANIIGLELNRPVRAGQCLESHFLLQPLCARQGENVAVASDNGALRIVMRAKALASGRKNERILCLNEASGRRLFVRLTGTREATAEY